MGKCNFLGLILFALNATCFVKKRRTCMYVGDHSLKVLVLLSRLDFKLLYKILKFGFIDSNGTNDVELLWELIFEFVYIY